MKTELYGRIYGSGFWRGESYFVLYKIFKNEDYATHIPDVQIILIKTFIAKSSVE